MGAAGSPQPQSIELHDPLEVRKQHLHLLSIFTRLPIKAGLGEGTGNIACRLVNAASYLANRCVRTTTGLYRAARAISFPGRIVNPVVFGDVGTRLLKGRHSLRSE